MDEVGADKVSSALLYAAAKFNAFIVASQDDLDIENEKDGAAQFFLSNIEKCLLKTLRTMREILYSFQDIIKGVVYKHSNPLAGVEA